MYHDADATEGHDAYNGKISDFAKRSRREAWRGRRSISATTEQERNGRRRDQARKSAGWMPWH